MNAKEALLKILFVLVDEICDDAVRNHKEKFSGCAINWGNFGCVDVAIVNAVHDGEYIQILLAEAAPSGNQKFTEWLENRLKDRFMIDIPIHIIMEW